MQEDQQHSNVNPRHRQCGQHVLPACNAFAVSYKCIWRLISMVDLDTANRELQLPLSDPFAQGIWVNQIRVHAHGYAAACPNQRNPCGAGFCRQPLRGHKALGDHRQLL